MPMQAVVDTCKQNSESHISIEIARKIVVYGIKEVNDLIKFMDGFFLMSTLFTNANRMPVNCYNFGVLEHQNYVVCIAFGTRISFQKRTLNS